MLHCGGAMNRIQKMFFGTMIIWMVAAVWNSSAAFASGFGIFTQGAEALGRANAVVASGDGPSVLFFNPALMNRLPGTQMEVGTTLIFPQREFRDRNGTTSSTRDEVFYPSTVYLTHAFNNTLSAGLGVF